MVRSRRKAKQCLFQFITTCGEKATINDSLIIPVVGNVM